MTRQRSTPSPTCNGRKRRSHWASTDSYTDLPQASPRRSATATMRRVDRAPAASVDRALQAGQRTDRHRAVPRHRRRRWTRTIRLDILHDRVLATCDGMQADVHRSAREISRRSKIDRSLWANRLDHHPSARANAIAAERILETYSGQWVASPATMTPPCDALKTV